MEVPRKPSVFSESFFVKPIHTKKRHCLENGEMVIDHNAQSWTAVKAIKWMYEKANASNAFFFFAIEVFS